jgi:activator of HSP90 ATPase
VGVAKSNLAERLVFSFFILSKTAFTISLWDRVVVKTGHEAILTTTIDQESDSTKVTFTLNGVPTGLEDEIRNNIEGY